MACLNQVELIGYVGRDPEKAQVGNSNTNIVRFSVATSRSWKQDGERHEETEWHNIVSYSNIAEFILKAVKKGAQVYVRGRIRHRKYTGKDGVERVQDDIVADTFLLLGKNDNATQGNTQEVNGNVKSNDDVPF